MLSEDRVIEWVRSGNPVPDERELPLSRMTAIELLSRGTEVSDMHATERITRSETRSDPAASRGVGPGSDGRWRGLVVAVAVFASIVVAAGVLIALAQLGEEMATGPDPVTPTTLALALDEATARSLGAPYDPASHDLCAWFEPGEVDEIVAAAYEVVGATPSPTAFSTGEPPTFPPVACSWSTENVVLDAPDWDGSGFHHLMLSVDGGIASGDPRILTLSGVGEVVIQEEERQGYLEQRTDDGFAPMEELSDDVAFVGAVVKNLHAWNPPGSPAMWQQGTVRLRVDGRSDIFLTTSVISDPPVSFASGPVSDRIVDMGLAVAQDLLEAMNWIEE